MASITKRNDKWRVSICKFGQRKSATFDTKAEAKLWANKVELEIQEVYASCTCPTPLCEVIERYKREISVHKRSHSKEKYLLDTLARTDFAKKPISNVTSIDIKQWRDGLLERYANNTVIRLITTLKHVYTIATGEWGLVTDNPCSSVRKPSAGKPRNRRIAQKEIEDIAASLGWKPDKKLSDIAAAYPSQDIAVTFSQKVAIHHFTIAVVFLFALETGMRLSEILNLSWTHIDIDKKVAFLPLTKNGDSRYVPLSKTAISLLRQVRTNTSRVFNVQKANLQATFKRLTDKLGIKNLHFHDTRHEAVTRLAKKLNVLDLARMIGHKNISQLMTYYNPSAEEIARNLD